MSDKYEEIIASIDRDLASINVVNNDEEMSMPHAGQYTDPYTTKQQKLRDEVITTLLKSYVDSYKSKVFSNKIYKGIIFAVCMLILIVFSVIFGVLIVSISQSNRTTAVQNTVSLITVSITFLTLIIGILQTITKYVFPENEEEYVTKIVEIIQNNDLENKKENIRVNESKE